MKSLQIAKNEAASLRKLHAAAITENGTEPVVYEGAKHNKKRGYYVIRFEKVGKAPKFVQTADMYADGISYHFVCVG